jgi:hypothetical protein
MNKDLAGVTAIWRTLFGVRDRRFTACLHVVKEPPKMVFAADERSVSGDGRSFRCCTVGELLRDCDFVSVMGVQEKCDEKRQALTRMAFGFRHFAASRENNFRCSELAEHNTK